jgi:hypothetical protein
MGKVTLKGSPGNFFGNIFIFIFIYITVIRKIMSLKILTNYVAIFAGAIPDERIDFIIVNGNVDIQIR